MIYELNRALIAHKSKLEMIEEMAKSASEQMQQILAVDLDSFGMRLKSWAAAAPIKILED